MKLNTPSSKRKHRFDVALKDDLTELLREKILSLPTSVKTDYLKNEVFSKYLSEEIVPAEVRAQAAIDKWLAQERINEETEERLILTPEEYNILPRVTSQRFVEFCCDLIVDLLGEVPPDDVLLGTFSGGASTSRSRTYSHPANKYLGEAHVTLDSLGHLSTLVDACPSWFNAQSSLDLSIKVVPGNVMFTVPKKTEIDRVAAKEPDLNMYFQKGIGSFIRKALLRTGINLNDQSINRSLALEGSMTNRLATLDLSSASDSVTTELVFQLLPVNWYTLLNSVRSKETILPNGEVHRNQMFSSMGNGFTFELESLLFYVLMRATAYFTGTPGVVSVYGDDLIIPSEMVHEAIFVLNHFGFKVNTKKSHFDGPFRESCGGHYWNGFDITPFYIKGPVTTLLDLIHVANQLRKWGESVLNGELLSSILSPEIEELWLWCKSQVPEYLWGGSDTSFKYQLASVDVPVNRISQETKKRKTGRGGYLMWLNTTWGRTFETDGIQTSLETVDLGLYRLRKVRSTAVPRHGAIFLHEI